MRKTFIISIIFSFFILGYSPLFAGEDDGSEMEANSQVPSEICQKPEDIITIRRKRELSTKLKAALSNPAAYGVEYLTSDNQREIHLCFKVSGNQNILIEEPLSYTHTILEPVVLHGLFLSPDAQFPANEPLLKMENKSGSRVSLKDSFIIGSTGLESKELTCLEIGNSDNILIQNLEISNCGTGIKIDSSQNIQVLGSSVNSNRVGIEISNSEDIFIGDRIDEGREFSEERANKIFANEQGIRVSDADSQRIYFYHNSLFDNGQKTDVNLTNSIISGIDITSGANNYIFKPESQFYVDKSGTPFFIKVQGEVSNDCTKLTSGAFQVKIPRITGKLETYFVKDDGKEVKSLLSQGREFFQEFVVTNEMLDSTLESESFEEATIVEFPIGICGEMLGRYIAFIFHDSELGSTSYSEKVTEIKTNPDTILTTAGMPAPPTNAGGLGGDGNVLQAEVGGQEGGAIGPESLDFGNVDNSIQLENFQLPEDFGAPEENEKGQAASVDALIDTPLIVFSGPATDGGSTSQASTASNSSASLAKMSCQLTSSNSSMPSKTFWFFLFPLLFIRVVRGALSRRFIKV